MKTELLNRTFEVLQKLPEEKIQEVTDYTDFLFMKYEEEILRSGIQKLSLESKVFDFLKDEEDLYTLDDLKVRYK